MLHEGVEDITAFADPRTLEPDLVHQPTQSVNKDIKRSTNVVGSIPKPSAVEGFAGEVLIEIHAEWQVTNRSDLSEASVA